MREIPSSILMANMDANRNIENVHEINLIDILQFYQEQLTEKQRAVYRHYYEEGKTQRATARILGTSRENIKAHISAIRIKAKRIFLTKK